MGGAKQQVPRPEIERARRYADALRSFLCGCTTWTVDPESRSLLVEVQRSLEFGRECIEQILAANPPPEPPAPPATREAPPADPGASARSVRQPVDTASGSEVSGEGAAVVEGPAGQRTDVVMPGRTARAEDGRSPSPGLMLKDTEAEPCLQEFQGRRELAPDTVAKLDAFAEENELEMTEHERRRFLQNVQRWIETTPEGQVLTIRVSRLHGAPKPYPQYRPDPSHKAAPGD